MNSAIVLCLLLATVRSAYSIKCYGCQSSKNADCGSGDLTVLEKFKTDCGLTNAAYTAAHGGVQLDRCVKIYTSSNGQTVRGCQANDPSYDGTCKTTNGVTACLCAGDYCNSAYSNYASGSLLLLAITALFSLIVAF